MMALIKMDIFSKVLEMNVQVNVILPQPDVTLGKRSKNRLFPESFRYQVLWLLHGLSDDQSIWGRMTSIERYASGLGLAVVMPNGGRSFYHNTYAGMRYHDFLVQELPMLMSGFFPFSTAREDNFIAGLSMGGYGSLLTALTHPGRFAAVASLSGVTDLLQWTEDEAKKNERGLMWQIFGDKPSSNLKKAANLYELSRSLARGTFRRMPIYQCCGTEDFLYQQNTSFRDHLKKLGLNLTYVEGPGSHEWGYWDAQIQEVLRWLPLRKSKISFIGK